MTLLARVVAAMRLQCESLVLNANGDPARLGEFGFPIVADDVQGFLGPLAGILAGLDWIAAHFPDVKYAVSVPADTVPAGRSCHSPHGGARGTQRHGRLRAIGREDASFGCSLARRDQTGFAPCAGHGR
jgi:hypothetical protein